MGVKGSGPKETRVVWLLVGMVMVACGWTLFYYGIENESVHWFGVGYMTSTVGYGITLMSLGRVRRWMGRGDD